MAADVEDASASEGKEIIFRDQNEIGFQVPTRVRLWDKNVQLGANCLWCMADLERAEHVLLFCNKSRKSWCNLNSRQQITRVQTQSGDIGQKIFHVLGALSTEEKCVCNHQLELVEE